MEGPKVPSEARRREAQERRGGWDLGRGTVAPPQYGGLGLCPQKNFQKINIEIAILGHFCKLKWSFVKWRQGRIRH